MDTTASRRAATIRERGELRLLGEHPIPFDSRAQLAFIRRPPPFHPNGLIFRAFDAAGLQLCSREYYSVGGGFVVDEQAAGSDRIVEDATALATPFAALPSCSITALPMGCPSAS